MKVYGLVISFLLLFIQIQAEIEEVDDVVIETVEESVSDIPYESPKPLKPSSVYLAEHFDNKADFEKKWTKSQAKKEGISEDIAKYDGEWKVEEPQKDSQNGDLGLVLKSKAKHAAIASPLNKHFVFDEKPLIVQYEVTFQDGQECGGAYIKLLSKSNGKSNLSQFHDKTPYSIMFGPDKCGNDHKLHFIFQHKNPLTGEFEEKHCKKPKDRLDEVFSDKLPHLFALHLDKDNTFKIFVDKSLVNSGSLLEDFTPSVNPPKEIDDPNDKKPEDWDEREKIPDPQAVKPDDWDENAPAEIVDEDAQMPDGWLENEPTHIPDPNAQKPEDWDSDMDGEWEAPLIDNPKCANAPGCGPWEPPLIKNPVYKGKWRAPLIDNPNYKGKWKPRRIPNPDFFEDKEPFKMPPVEAIGFELWSMSRDILFDNILITDDIMEAEQWIANTFDKKRQRIARDSESVLQKLADITNEYPAIWVLYIIVLAIPVVFVLYLCCKPSSASSRPQEKDETRAEAKKKKTDEPTEDIAGEAVEQDEEDEDDGDKKDEDDDEDKEKNSEPDSDYEDDEASNQDGGATAAASASPGGGGDVEGGAARKRKVRKE